MTLTCACGKRYDAAGHGGRLPGECPDCRYARQLARDRKRYPVGRRRRRFFLPRARCIRCGHRFPTLVEAQICCACALAPFAIRGRRARASA